MKTFSESYSKDNFFNFASYYLLVMCVSLDNIFEPVQQEMKDFESFFSKSLMGTSSLLNEIIGYILEKKGKRIRPLLVFLSASATGKEIGIETFVGAASIEMLHTATLLHDDVVDESKERRGRKSVQALWNSKAAVLVGDYLLAKGLILITDNKLSKLLDIMASPIAAMSEGELIQIEKSTTLDISEDVYFDVIKKKTASLMASSMLAGVLSVDGDSELGDLMHKIGELIGIAFQIRDDIFDYQKTNKAGKTVGNDIIEKKITLPLLCALKKVSKSEQENILNLVSDASDNKENVETVQDFVVQHNGMEDAQKIAEQYSIDAISLLEQLKESPARQALIDLAKYTVNRKK